MGDPTGRPRTALLPCLFRRPRGCCRRGRHVRLRRPMGTCRAKLPDPPRLVMWVLLGGRLGRVRLRTRSEGYHHVQDPPHAQAPHLTSQRSRPHDRRSFLMHRDPRSPSSPLSPCKLAEPLCIHQELGCGRRAGRTRRRAHRRVTRYRTRRRATCRLITARLWLGQYGGPACPRLLARAASPRRQRKARAPRRPWDAGSKKRVQVLICLILRWPGGGRRWP